MFQPNSIKSLLRRKDEKALESNEQGKSAASSSLSDPEVELLIENKTTIKEMDMTIQNIREWRQQQSQHLEYALRMNQQLAEALQAQPSGAADYQAELDRHSAAMRGQQQRLQELQQELAREEQASSESQIRHQLVRDRLEDSDRRRDALVKVQEAPLKDHQEAFIESVLTINDVFRKRQAEEEDRPRQPMQAQAIRGELDEIDRELRELEDLLKDVEG